MKILLNAELIENPRVPYPYVRENGVSNYDARKEALRSLHSVVVERYPASWAFHSSDMRDQTQVEYSDGFVDVLATAYSWHRRIRVAPHDLWYIVLTEIANVINEKSEEFRSLFTRSDEKQAIVVPGNDVLNYLEVVEYLRELMPLDPELFVFDLTTMGPAEHRAMASALCDGVQRYYSYFTFCCGIPEILLTGTEQDWATLEWKAEQIRVEFGLVTNVLDEYLARVRDTFKSIKHGFIDRSPDLNRQFWTDIFSQHNVGSGGQKEIDGWIRHLFVKNRERRIEAFQHTRSMVPYQNVNTGDEYVAVLGAHTVGRDAEGFMHTIYNETIFKRVGDDPKARME